MAICFLSATQSPEPIASCTREKNCTDRSEVNHPQQAFNKNFIATTSAVGEPALCIAERWYGISFCCSEWSCLSPLCSACGVAASAEHPFGSHNSAAPHLPPAPVSHPACCLYSLLCALKSSQAYPSQKAWSPAFIWALYLPCKSLCVRFLFMYSLAASNCQVKTTQ